MSHHRLLSKASVTALILATPTLMSCDTYLSGEHGFLAGEAFFIPCTMEDGTPFATGVVLSAKRDSRCDMFENPTEDPTCSDFRRTAVNPGSCGEIPWGYSRRNELYFGMNIDDPTDHTTASLYEATAFLRSCDSENARANEERRPQESFYLEGEINLEEGPDGPNLTIDLDGLSGSVPVTICLYGNDDSDSVDSSTTVDTTTQAE